MLFWVIAAMLTLGASLAVLLPLAGASEERARSSGDHDLEVYRDQLVRTGARRRARPDPAGGSRTGARRDRAPHPSPRHCGDEPARRQPAGSVDGARLVATVAVLAVPLVSWGLYGEIGSPDLPSQPLSERLAQEPGRQFGRRTGGARRGASCRQPVGRPRLGRAGADLSAHAALCRRGHRLPQRHPPGRRQRRPPGRARRGDRQRGRRHCFGRCAGRPSRRR